MLDGASVELAGRVLALLRSRGESIATAESLTGGLLAATLTGVPGASVCFVGGVVAYATEVKVALLGVPQDVVDTHGVISGECALAMAQGAIRLTGATWAVATTGVAGPDRQEGHRPGTVHVAIAGRGTAGSFLLSLVGDREQVVIWTCARALSKIEGILQAMATREEGRLG